jgi:hypothetical protein
MEKLSVKSNSGQALLVILLIMAVVLTIGLATISRSITDIKISEQTDDSARAFSAAEAGIEALLSGAVDGTGLTFDSTTKVVTLKTDITGTSFLYPQALGKNEIATIWLSEFDNDTKKYKNFLNTTANNLITVAWGNENAVADQDTTPALEVSLYYDNSGAKVAKFLLDPFTSRENNFCKTDTTNCANISNFVSPAGLYGDKNLKFKADIDVSSLGAGLNMYFARLRLLYNDTAHYIGLSTNNLPKQGIKIAATGTSNQATRKVEVYRLNPAPPDIFDFALYSGGSLVK